MLLAVGAYACALLAFGTALIVTVTDFAATSLLPKPRPNFDRNITVIRRFWHRSSAPVNQWLAPDPIVPVIIYIAIFQIWHVSHCLYFVDGGRGLLDVTSESGVSLRALVHAVNALVLAYLVVHWAGSLFPHSRAPRNQQIPIIVALVIVAAMHFAIL